MKMLRTKLFLTLAFALAAGGAFAQSTNKVPGPEEYSSFSRFITDRNIFDPNREPHYTSRPRTRTRTHTTRPSGAPTFTLVGTISYSKGMFAFFNGNNSDLKKALPIAGSIAGYTVTEISQGRVQLETPDKQTLELKVGDSMQEQNGKWELAENSGLPIETGAETATPENSTANEPTPAANPALESNDVLKRLMEQKEKENQ
jgi:hypothetical protein